MKKPEVTAVSDCHSDDSTAIETQVIMPEKDIRSFIQALTCVDRLASTGPGRPEKPELEGFPSLIHLRYRFCDITMVQIRWECHVLYFMYCSPYSAQATTRSHDDRCDNPV